MRFEIKYFLVNNWVKNANPRWARTYRTHKTRRKVYKFFLMVFLVAISQVIKDNQHREQLILQITYEMVE